MRKQMLAVIVALAIPAAACTRAPARPTAAPPVVTTIRLGTVGPDPRLDPVIAAFQTAHPEYRVEKVDFSPSPTLAQNLHEHPVDVVTSFLPLSTWGNYKQLTDLGPFLAKARFDTAPLGALLQADMVDGRIYALPVFGMPEVFAYNRELADKAGVSIPSGSWTWDELRTVASRLTSNTDAGKVWGFDWGFRDPVDLLYLHALQLAPDGATPDAEAVRQVFSFWQTMIFTDQSVPKSATGAPVSSEPIYLKLDQGRAALSPAVLVNGFLNKEQRIAPFPAVAGKKPTAFVRLCSLALVDGSAVPDAAWAFLSYAAGPEGAVVLARSGQFPVYATDATRQAWLESGPPPGAELLFAAALVEPSQWMMDTGELEIAFRGAASRVLAGTADADTAVQIYVTALARTQKR